MIKNAHAAFPEPIYEDIEDDDTILRKLSGYGSYALMELAGTTKNITYLNILNSNKLYDLPSWPGKPGDSSSFRIKRKLIGNPYTPAEVLCQIVFDPLFFNYLLESCPEKIKELVHHPGATVDILHDVADHLLFSKTDAVADHVVENILAALITCPLADEVFIIRFNNTSSLTVRIAIGQSKIPDLMFRDTAVEVRKEVAGNIHTSLIFLQTFSRPKTDNRIKIALAANPVIDAKIVSNLQAAGITAIDSRLLKNEAVYLSDSACVDMFERSLTAKDGWTVRLALAGRNHLPAPIAERLTVDSSVRVRARMAERLDISQEAIEMLAADPYPFVRAAVAGNPSVTLKILSRLQNDHGKLLDGLVNDKGEFPEGITANSIELPGRNISETVVSRLAGNEQILRLPALTARLIRNYQYRESIFKQIRIARDRALEAWEHEDYQTALDLIRPVTMGGYAPFGTLFIAGNCSYRTGDLSQAERYYRCSVSSMNNIMSILALDFLDRGEPIPRALLGAPAAVQTILQNLHLACPISSAINIADCMEFIHFISHPLPTRSSRTGSGDTRSWNSRLKNKSTEIFIALQVYGLCQVLRQGWLTLSSALTVLRSFLATGFDPQMTACQWQRSRRAFWRTIIRHSRLTPGMKRGLVSGNPETGEFFLRGGVQGLSRSCEFTDFREQLIMDNVPPVLREDLVRSVWFEWMDITENILFSEPLLCRRLFIVKEFATFGGIDQTLRVNLSLCGGDSRFGSGEIHSTVRSEVTHSITSGIFRNLGIVRAVDELQDRTSLIRFPAELKNRQRASEVIAVYARHDHLMQTLSQTALQHHSMDDPAKWPNAGQLKTPGADAIIQNALAALKNKEDTLLTRRMIGEALFLVFCQWPGLPDFAPALLDIVEKLKPLKARIRTFSWDTRIFFDGGAYLVTYEQPFPLPLPPLEPLFSPDSLVNHSRIISDEHYCGEWLHYLFRMRIRELLSQGILPVDLLEIFYPTASIYLASVTRHGELFHNMAVALTKCQDGHSGDAIRALLLETSQARLAGLSRDTQNDLIVLKNNIAGAIRMNTGKLAFLLSLQTIDQRMNCSANDNAMVKSYASPINASLAGKDTVGAAALTARLVHFLQERHSDCFADELKDVFLPADGETDMLAEEIRRFQNRHRHLYQTVATSIPEIVSVIQNMTPNSVLDPIRNRWLARAEPEKIVLKEAAHLLAVILLDENRLTFSQFAEILSTFYDFVYKYVRKQKIDVPVSDYIPSSKTYWKNIHIYIFSFLRKYPFLDLSSLESRFNQLRAENLENRQQP
jgi:hypothetical protein